MNLLRRRIGACLCGCVLAGGLSGRLFAQTALPELKDSLGPGYRPAKETDELGLWQLMDKSEKDLKTSRFVVRNEESRAYLQQISCKLIPDYCGDVRIYIVRTAQFNASMAPNGMMQVWTGLILRCLNEAQLAAVLAHEAGHYLKRHSLAQFRDVRDKAAVATFLGMGLAVAGLGIVGSLAQIGILASAFSFSRDQEREADAIGLALMSNAGYAPIAAAQIWQQLINELKASTAEKDTAVFFATHPAIEERVETLRKRAIEMGGDQGDFGRQRYLERVQPILPVLFADELKLRQYGRSEYIINEWLKVLPGDAQVHYASGELYRLRQQPGDSDRALAAFQQALALPNPPSDALRGAGLVYLERNDPARARENFEIYLKVAPENADRETVKTLLQSMPGGSS